MLSRSLTTGSDGPRATLRKRLLEERERFAGDPRLGDASSALGRQLALLLQQLEPQCLGLYWPVRGEFNAPASSAADAGLAEVPRALPFSRRADRTMQYRVWDGAAPRVVDECGIPGSDGAPVVPDVVLVPCVGFTADGLRLGYGGGYFDRWLAAHPQVVSVGVAWAAAKLDAAELQAEPHDQRLSLVVTEDGVV